MYRLSFNQLNVNEKVSFRWRIENHIVWLFVFVMAGNSFVMAYQNMWAMMSRSIAGERAFTNKHLGIYGIIYFIACFVALLIAILMWMNAGLFG